MRLTDTEVEICEIVGRIRNIKTSALCGEQIQSLLNPVQISIDGVLSEYMVAKHLDLFFDLNCDVRKFGADLISKKGAKIDVKSTRRKDGDLNIRITHKDKDYQIYVLVELDEQNNGQIVGFINREDAINDNNLANNLRTNEMYYKINRSLLKPL